MIVVRSAAVEATVKSKPQSLHPVIEKLPITLCGSASFSTDAFALRLESLFSQRRLQYVTVVICLSVLGGFKLSQQ